MVDLPRYYFRPMAEKIDIEASKNEDFNKLKLSDLNKRLHKIQEGGGHLRMTDQA